MLHWPLRIGRLRAVVSNETAAAAGWLCCLFITFTLQNEMAV